MIFKTLMEISLENFSPLQKPNNHLALSKINKPTYEEYRDLHNKVGEPYDWASRARINDINKITALLADDKVELWQFHNNSMLIGYALFSCAENKTAELEDFGFFPDHCGLGFGNFFLSAILERMAQRGIKKAWLTTRSTNHPKVVSFYEKMGFTITSRVPISGDTQ